MTEPSAKGQVILVEDDPALRDAITQSLDMSGLDVRAFDNARRALRYVVPSFAGCIITDVRMDGMDGLELFDEVMGIDRKIPVILITGHGDIDMAVRAMRDGAFDFLAKPFASAHLMAVVRKALDWRALALENRALRAAMIKPPEDFIARSRPMVRLCNLAAQVAGTELDILIEGESGTGKEALAASIHRQSRRHAGPFVVLPASAIEGELDCNDLMERAGAGTLFIDRCETLPSAAQARLLSLIDLRDRSRTQADQSLDFRLITAAQPLQSECANFDPELLHRLGSVTLCVPPLRERREDVPLLFARFVREALDQIGKKRFELNTVDRRRLLEHDWPGNLHELRRYSLAVALNLPRNAPNLGADIVAKSLNVRLSAIERAIVVETLEATGGNVVRAARALGTPRKTLYDKLARHRIDPAALRASRREE